MKKRLFYYLLKKYSKTEKDRIKILSKLDEKLYDEYSEQTPFGNVYNYFIEFIISNKFIKQRVNMGDTDSINIIKNGILKTFNDSIGIIKNEKI